MSISFLSILIPKLNFNVTLTLDSRDFKLYKGVVPRGRAPFKKVRSIE